MLKIQKHPLPHYNERPTGVQINTLVIHSMCAENSCGLECDPEKCIEELDRHKVAAHFVIGRCGGLWQLVDENARAWHAGVSKMPPTAGATVGVNDFSIGIELVGLPDQTFSEAQYDTLTRLTIELQSRHPIQYIIGHSHIAQPPGRKSDPGHTFDWDKYKHQLSTLNQSGTELCFPID